MRGHSRWFYRAALVWKISLNVTPSYLSTKHTHVNFQIDENVITKCGKMIILDKMLTELKKRGHKVCIYLAFTEP